MLEASTIMLSCKHSVHHRFPNCIMASWYVVTLRTCYGALQIVLLLLVVVLLYLSKLSQTTCNTDFRSDTFYALGLSM